MKQETYNQLTKHEKYCLYLGETFEGAKELIPAHLENGVSDLTTSMIKDFGQFSRLLIIGIQDQAKAKGEDNDSKTTDCELFNPANTEKARDRLKNKIKKSFDPAIQTIMEQAKKAVLHPESMDHSESVLLETVKHYDPKRDTPSVNILNFEEWRAENG